RRVRRELERNPQSVLIHEEQLTVLHKFAVLYCRGATIPREFPIHVVRTMLAYNYLLGHENMPVEIGGTHDFVKLELRSLFHQNEGILSLIHRFVEFVHWTDGDEARSLAEYLPVHHDFQY